MHRLVAVLAVLLSVAGARAQDDHLQCFKIKDTQAKTTYTADIDGIVLEPGCILKVPAAMACLPATKSNVMPTPPGGGGSGPTNGFFCYKTKCPKVAPPTVVGEDQFGSRTVTPSKLKLVCAPLAGPSTTTTSTTATTTTTCPLPRLSVTGQTTCWNASGTVVPCAGTGSDGEFQAGAPFAFVDNGDGTVTDLNTSLTWEKKSDDGTIHDKDTQYVWANASPVHVAGLNSANFAGHSDWRVPNVKEMHSIVSYAGPTNSIPPAFNNNCVSGCTVLTCSCTGGVGHWSSTTGPGTAQAWSVSVNNGSIDALPKSFAGDVRAVRGP